MKHRGFYFETEKGILYYYNDLNGCVTVVENDAEKRANDHEKSFRGSTHTNTEFTHTNTEFTHTNTELLHEFELADKEKISQEIMSRLEIDGYNQLILILTHDCNIRCRYCVYSGNYENRRVHHPLHMTSEVARAAIKWYIDAFKRTKEINPRKIPTIGFYGGEPLLSFGLIKEIVKYAKELYPGKMLFNLTTNGTLLSDEVVDFLVEMEFAIVITLNGPQAEHDRLRVFPDGTGSFDIIWKNLMKLRERYPIYYKDNCILTMDYDFGTDLNLVRSFFEQYEEILPEIGTVNPILMFFTKWYEQYSIEEKRKFVNLLENYHQEYLSELREGRKPSFLWNILGERYDMILKRSQSTQIEDTDHILPYTGTCYPGTKIAVDPYGNFHCCERMSENFPIGNINVGLDMDRIIKIIELYRKQIFPKCLDCSVTRFCPVCFAILGGENNFEENPGGVKLCDMIQADVKNLFTRLWSAMEKSGAKKPIIPGTIRTLRVDACIKKGA